MLYMYALADSSLVCFNVYCEVYLNIALPPAVEPLNPSTALMDAYAARVNGYSNQPIIATQRFIGLKSSLRLLAHEQSIVGSLGISLLKALVNPSSCL